MKAKIEMNLKGIEETLLIPLYARSIEAKKDNPRFQDQKAIEMIDKINYDFSRFKSSYLSIDGCISRTIIIDRMVNKFIKEHENCVVISIGCGLDTRFSRLDNGKISWYEIDLPEVIELRKKFFTETERHKMIAKSCFDEEWLDMINEINTKPILILSEGVLMYFTKEQVISLFKMIRKKIPKAMFIIELMTNFTVALSSWHDSVGKTGNTFTYGVNSANELETYIDGLKYDYEENVSNEIGWFIGFLVRWFNDRVAQFHFE